MGSSILDWFSGNYTPSTQQSQEAAKYADDAYMQQTQGGMAPGMNVNPWGFGNSSNQGVDAGPTSQAASRALTEYNSQTGPVTQSPWLQQAAAGGGGGNGSTPPTYSAAGLGQMGNGVINYTGNDPALRATLGAAGAGDITYGTAAFGANNYASMQNLANQLGFDTSGYKTTDSLRIALDDQLKDYFMVNGLSQGWNNTGDARGANGTLYQRVDGQLRPVSTQAYTAPEKGNWIQEHPGILAPLGVAAGGLAAMYSGAGAAGSGAAASGTSGAATTAGAAGAGTGGISGSIANALGLGSQWGALPAWGQGAISNAVMGGLNSGLRGGNILEGAALGGISGGVGGGISSGLTGAGVGSGLAGAAGRLGGGLAAGLAGGNTNLAGMLQSGVINAGMGYAGNQLGLGSGLPTDNSLGAIMARLAAQQGGSYLAEQLDPRLRGLGGQAGSSLATLFQNRYS